MYDQLALAGPRALKGSSQLLLQPIGARASERPCSNERPSTRALELCETAEEASLRLLAEFRLHASKTRPRCPWRNEISQNGPIASHIAANLLRKGAAAAMPPPRMFQRRRRQLFALMGQPLFPFLAVLLLAAQCCSAQPHAREDHAQHIMNQARANQKASRPVCNSRVGRGEHSTPSRSEGRRIDGVRVASMAYGAPTRE